MSQFGIFLNFIINRDIESKKKSDKISPSHVNSIALVRVNMENIYGALMQTICAAKITK